MEKETTAATRQHDHIWRRVTPDVDPYAIPVMGTGSKVEETHRRQPEMTRPRGAETAPGGGEMASSGAKTANHEAYAAACGGEMTPGGGEMTPGGAMDRAVLDLIAAEFSDQRYYMTLARRGGPGSRLFRQLAAEEGSHARRLEAVYFLLTGRRAPDCVAVPSETPARQRDALRERYREECCGAALYADTAEKLPWLREVFLQLSREEREHAAKLLRLLEQVI